MLIGVVGEPREFANKILDDWLIPRYSKMTRPHMRASLLSNPPYLLPNKSIPQLTAKPSYLVLSILYVHPQHRRRGVASMLIEWGFQKADDLGIESIVEATAEGRPCYMANGFRYISTFHCDPTKNDESAEWLALSRRLQTPIPLFLMWRPKGGKYVEGRTEIPEGLFATE